MSVIKIITPPACEPLTLTEAQIYLRTDEDISALITAAREWCEDYQGKKYITQTLELILDSFPETIEFRNCSPVQSITSIKYTDYTGLESTIETSEYILDNDSFVNRIVTSYGKAWPSVLLQAINGVRVRFIAGYGSESAVPQSVKQAMILQIRLLYNYYSPDEREKLERARDALLGMRRVVPV